MKKNFILLCSALCMMGVNAQDQDSANTANDTISAWKAKGNASFLFNQSTFDNWLAGGENNISGNAGLNYDINYKKGEWSWDNKLIASYGIVKTRTSAFAKKTDDRIEFNSTLGKSITERWNYSAFLNFRTQFAKGYNYSQDENGAEVREEYTNFLSPAYLLVGPGFLYKKDDNFKFNLSPATSKFTFVDKAFTLPDEAYFGVEEGKTMRYELGFNASAYYKLGVIANVTFENIVNLYSNYLEDPQNVDIDYQLNIVMKINRYLTTNLSFQTIYDDNAFKGFQIRQVFGVAANYGF
ncbi:DUF3078 domain-containing protein [Flavobacterium litorale]|uniref:DUF3078 domain-containing protein n=1 Tax=Flavobacterium litorale TaxID=2856519 RepID=A0ABX8V843_9FLAO|nr:DUF3078 domain-containing protein [Flavobacterium litorale]QYJ68990.1 DUF3078 domain-containing protein [Flavobacterium litorale]